MSLKTYDYSLLEAAVIEDSRILCILPSSHLLEFLDRYEFLIHTADAGSVELELTPHEPVLSLDPHSLGLLGPAVTLLPLLGGAVLAQELGFVFGPDDLGEADLGDQICLTHAGVRRLQDLLAVAAVDSLGSARDYRLTVGRSLWVWVDRDAPAEVGELLRELGGY